LCRYGFRDECLRRFKRGEGVHVFKAVNHVRVDRAVPRVCLFAAHRHVVVLVVRGRWRRSSTTCPSLL
jgi:hypothetical protein